MRVILSKHASMELSINTIVVLVIAIAVLGLGLAFTKNMFSKFKSSFSVPTPEYDATSSEPIVFSTDEIPFGTKQTDLPVSIYNKCPGAISGTAMITLRCKLTSGAAGTIDTGNAPGLAAGGISLSGILPDISPGQASIARLLVNVTSTSTGKASCEIGVKCDAGAATNPFFTKAFYAKIIS